MKFTKEHEWIKIEDGKIALVGISDHAQNNLGDITFVELPKVGTVFAAGDSFGVVESVKAASDVYMPVSGRVVEVNSKLEDSPELLNSDPEGGAWILKVELSNPAELDSLMTRDQYLATL